MTLTKVLCAALLTGAAATSLACENPPLTQIPEDLNDREKARVRVEVATYFEAMRAYTACVQAELVAAGGDNAAPLTKAALVARNNGAVAEAEAMLKIFTENVGPLEPTGPPSAPR